MVAYRFSITYYFLSFSAALRFDVAVAAKRSNGKIRIFVSLVAIASNVDARFLANAFIVFSGESNEI